MFKQIPLLLLAASLAWVARAEPAMHSAPITDPVLKMTAWTLELPKGWNLDATMLPGSSCAAVTTPVFHATSGDGHSGVYFLPRADWSWGTNIRPGSDCLPLHEATSAHDYLTGLIRTRGVGFVSEEPVPELSDMRRNFEAQDRQIPGLHRSVDMARFRVRYELERRLIDELDTVVITCNDNQIRTGAVHSCSATATRWYAPKDSLDMLLPTFRAMKLTPDPQWMQAWRDLTAASIERRSREQTNAMLQQGRLAQQARETEHSAFMASMAQSRDVSRQRFVEGQFRKQQQTDNFVDHVLDCQRVYSGNTRVSVGSNCPNRQTY